ncbi:MAG: fumarylacetoacetate hydrolase family protein [Alicyclobacillaceae bacterium]|nr:fumarylacetoacetate hydrolase family protein [Alicyclobacillaceae bacterium]
MSSKIWNRDEPWLRSTEAIEKIRNIFCVGRNYRDHATELGNEVPAEPLIFGKSTHALASASHPIKLPRGRANIHHELEWVLFIARDHVVSRPFSDCVGGVALGLDLTDRDAQNRLKAAGQPWELAKGFPGSAVVTDFYTVQDWEEFSHLSFSLVSDGRALQRATAAEMIFPWQVLVDYVGEHFGLQAGDILYTGTPAGVGRLTAGQVLEFHVDGLMMARTTVEKMG